MRARALRSGVLASAFAAVPILSLPAAQAAPQVLHQSKGAVIVRLSADDQHVSWQTLGDADSERYLYAMDLKTRKLSRFDSPKPFLRKNKRPFGPSVSGGYVLFGAGKIFQKIDVSLHDLRTGKTQRLQKRIPWIVEPSLQVYRNDRGQDEIHAVWETSKDSDGDGLAIQYYRARPGSRGERSTLISGPLLRREEIPAEYHSLVRNEYPALGRDALAFQNNEFGPPNVYRYNFASGQYARLSPSAQHQERPAIDGPYTAWEQSERGFAESQASSIYLHDARTGETRKLDQEPGFHYQALIRAPFVVYGAKRQPEATTPSLRVFDLEKNAEIEAQGCFSGVIWDYAANAAGAFAAIKVTSQSSRIVFASWEDIRNNCR